jgi:hypothetical protein
MQPRCDWASCGSSTLPALLSTARRKQARDGAVPRAAQGAAARLLRFLCGVGERRRADRHNAGRGGAEPCAVRAAAAGRRAEPGDRPGRRRHLCGPVPLRLQGAARRGHALSRVCTACQAPASAGRGCSPRPPRRALRMTACGCAVRPGASAEPRARRQAREKQMARLGREEGLAALSLRLATGKRIKLADLRSFARVVRTRGSHSFATYWGRPRSWLRGVHMLCTDPREAWLDCRGVRAGQHWAQGSLLPGRALSAGPARPWPLLTPAALPACHVHKAAVPLADLAARLSADAASASC